MAKEPIRHHYIPQFILRNFACDSEKQKVFYCDKESRIISERDIRDIFMERNLYRDEINYEDNPTQIEKDLSVYEREISELIKGKFLSGRKIELTRDEEEKLKLFFAIMSFRGISTKEQFGGKISNDSKAFYKFFQPNEDFEDFWKRNLGYLVKCRSMEEVFNHTEIDTPIKIFMQRDVNGLVGKYIIVVEPKEGDGFILGDCYPVAMSGDNIPMYDVFPISPNRALMLACVGVDATPRHVLTLRPGVFDLPKTNDEGQIITTKRLYLEEVQYLNTEIEKHSHKGFVFKKVIQ